MNPDALLYRLRSQSFTMTVHNGKLRCEFPEGTKATELLDAVKLHKEELLSLLGDPRPDLREDTALWQQVLSEAESIDHSLYGSLHGVRCGGGRLKWKSGHLHLDYQALLSLGWTDKQIRNEWLMPQAEGIKRAFHAVEQRMRQAG